ncbi:hypothetical protein B5S31_g5401 [[Candida] boidinii]|nr:hypothetical protein B5S31_g5401 [[Candida] boidinii]
MSGLSINTGTNKYPKQQNRIHTNEISDGDDHTALSYNNEEAIRSMNNLSISPKRMATNSPRYTPYSPSSSQTHNHHNHHPHNNHNSHNNHNHQKQQQQHFNSQQLKPGEFQAQHHHHYQKTLQQKNSLRNSNHHHQHHHNSSSPQLSIKQNTFGGYFNTPPQQQHSSPDLSYFEENTDSFNMSSNNNRPLNNTMSSPSQQGSTTYKGWFPYLFGKRVASNASTESDDITTDQFLSDLRSQQPIIPDSSNEERRRNDSNENLANALRNNDIIYIPELLPPILPSHSSSFSSTHSANSVNSTNSNDINNNNNNHNNNNNSNNNNSITNDSNATSNQNNQTITNNSLSSSPVLSTSAPLQNHSPLQRSKSFKIPNKSTTLKRSNTFSASRSNGLSRSGSLSQKSTILDSCRCCGTILQYPVDVVKVRCMVCATTVVVANKSSKTQTNETLLAQTISSSSNNVNNNNNKSSTSNTAQNNFSLKTDKLQSQPLQSPQISEQTINHPLEPLSYRALKLKIVECRDRVKNLNKMEGQNNLETDAEGTNHNEINLHEAFKPLEEFLYNSFSSLNCLNRSFQNESLNTSPGRHPNLIMEEIKQFYDLVVSLPTKRPLFKLLLGGVTLLRNPPQLNEFNDIIWLLILLEIPILPNCLISGNTSTKAPTNNSIPPSQSNSTSIPNINSNNNDSFLAPELKAVSYDILKRIIGLISYLDKKLTKQLTIWWMNLPNNEFIKKVDFLNLYITFQLTRCINYELYNSVIRPGSNMNNKNASDDINYKDALSCHFIRPTALSSDFGLSIGIPVHISRSSNQRSNNSNSNRTLLWTRNNVNNQAVNDNSNNDKNNEKDHNIRIKLSQYCDDWHLRTAGRLFSILFIANRNYNGTNQKFPDSIFYNNLVDYVNMKNDFDAWQLNNNNYNQRSSTTFNGNIHSNNNNAIDDDDDELLLFNDEFVNEISSNNYVRQNSNSSINIQNNISISSKQHNLSDNIAGETEASNNTNTNSNLNNNNEPEEIDTLQLTIDYLQNEAASKYFGMISPGYSNLTKKKNSFTFCQYPFLISLAAKISLLEYEAKKMMERKAEEAFIQSLNKKTPFDVYFKVRVRRNNITEDSLRIIKNKTGEFKKLLKVEFVGEEGIDAGGLKKEWFLLLTKDLFNPEKGLFSYNSESNLCWFSINNLENPELYYLVGVVLGLSIYNSTILDLKLPKVLYKKIMNYRITLDDYIQVYPSSGLGLKKLFEMNDDESIDSLELYFEITYQDIFGNNKDYQLIENGANIKVNNENKVLYIEKYIDFYFNRINFKQFKSFYKGFQNVIGGNALSLFTPEEIELILVGNDNDIGKLDIDILKSITKYQGWGIITNEMIPLQINWFWEFFNELNNKRQRNLLKFITGSDRLPATGLPSLNFKITKLKGDCKRFPIAHTCFNELCLYDYKSKDELVYKLDYAINNSEGFQLR